jgi:endonuclease YncB( thermonuclease family)
MTGLPEPISGQACFDRLNWKFGITGWGLLLSILFISSCKLPVPPGSGTVVRVRDGDSIILLDDKKQEIEVRLAHIDAPEYGQPYGRRSKEFLAEMIAGKQVGYRVYDDADRYGRTVAEVMLHDSINVNQEMVRFGHAWHFTRYSNSGVYRRLEKNARRQNIGLWADPDAVAPWEWRAR